MTAVRTYDESAVQTNAADGFATGAGSNLVNLTDFTSEVAAAFDAGLGGVLNFDRTSGSVALGAGFTITYGLLGAKSLTLTNSSPTNMKISTGVAG